jgi:hypothetical protein
LEEIASVTLPNELAVLGGAVSDDGSVLLWSPRGVWLVPQRRSPVVHLCPHLELLPRYAAFSKLSGQVEIYDSGSQRILGVDTENACHVSVLWTVGSDQSLVRRTASRWIEIGPRSSTQLSVRVQNGSNRETTISIPYRQPLRFGDAADYVTAPDGEATLVTEAWFPFRTFRVGIESDITVALDPAVQLDARTRYELLEGWQSLRLIPLDGAFLQVIADPRSDKRRVLVLNERGRLLRASILDVAIGMLDANRSNGLLIAVRDVGHRELVYYRWRWRAGN